MSDFLRIFAIAFEKDNEREMIYPQEDDEM